MATRTTFLKKGFPSTTPRGLHPFEFVVDLAVQNATATDIFSLWTIPADTFILWVDWEIITDAGAACTIDIGDTDSATTWFSNANMNQAAGTNGTMSGTAKLYTSSQTLSATIDHTNAVCKFRVFGLAANMAPNYTAA